MSRQTPCIQEAVPERRVFHAPRRGDPSLAAVGQDHAILHLVGCFSVERCSHVALHGFAIVRMHAFAENGEGDGFIRAESRTWSGSAA